MKSFEEWWATLSSPPNKDSFTDTLGQLDEFDTDGATDHVSYVPSIDLVPYLGEERTVKILYGNFNDELSSYMERLVKQGAKLVPVEIRLETGNRLTLYYYIKGQ
jgi:hypothetical protein